MRRTLLIAALLVLGTAVSGYARGEGHAVITIPIDFPPVDSANAVMGDASGVSKINDSLFFASDVFTYDGPFTAISVDFVVVTKDTATATGLCRDSATFILQTRDSRDSVKFWKRIATTTKTALAAWDSTGTAAARQLHMGADGDGVGFLNGGLAGTYSSKLLEGFGSPYRGIPSDAMTIADADSVANIGNEFRILTLYNAEEDSLQSHCILRSSAYIDILTKLQAIIRFHQR